jgi:ELWxxDGT repeat protein
LTVFRNEVLFDGVDAAEQNGLWVTDGTAAGTHELTDISGADAVGLDPLDFTVFKNEVLFTGLNAVGERGLWITDGTVAGTHEISGISGAFSGGLFNAGAHPPYFTVFNGEVLFQGMDANGQLGLWVTNGTRLGPMN